MSQPILVTGGGGILGRSVVGRLLAAGHEVRVLSRRPRPAGGPAHVGWLTGDLLGSDGLVQAVADVGVIVHCAGDPLRPRSTSMAPTTCSELPGPRVPSTWSTFPSWGLTASPTATTGPSSRLSG
jgi:nucleoside-diphosphate-sugar epimerase